jgi:hypothetical protein
MPREGEDVPGVGPFDGLLPNFLTSERGRSLRQQLTNLVDLMGRLRSGAAISAAEEERFARIIGSSGTDEELRRGIGIIRSELASRLGRGARVEGDRQRIDRLIGLGGLTEVQE